MSVRVTRLFALGAAVLVAQSHVAACRAPPWGPTSAPRGHWLPGAGGHRSIAVAVATTVLGLIGWGVLAGLERLTAQAGRVWLVLALVGVSGSLSMPLSGTGVS